MPAYDNNTPLATQQINQTQAPIQTNFNSLKLLIDINHVDFGDPNYGKHNLVSLVNQVASPPVGGFAATDVGIYNFVSPLTTRNEMFVNKINAGPVSVQIPMTAFNTGVDAGNPWGWTYLPSGIILKWGQINGVFPNGTWQTFVYPVGANIPVFNMVFNVSLQAVSIDVIPAQVQTFNYLTVNNNFTNLQFSWIPRTNFGNVNQLSLFYYAIGN